MKKTSNKLKTSKIKYLKSKKKNKKQNNLLNKKKMNMNFCKI